MILIQTLGSSWSRSYGSSLYNYCYAISVSCEFESCSWRDILDTLLCEKACQWLAAGQWFSLGTMVSSTNKPDRHDIAEIFLKVALKTITRNPEKRQSMADSSNDHLLPKPEITQCYSKCVIVYIVPKGFLFNKVLISDHQFSFILNYLI